MVRDGSGAIYAYGGRRSAFHAGMRLKFDSPARQVADLDDDSTNARRKLRQCRALSIIGRDRAVTRGVRFCSRRADCRQFTIFSEHRSGARCAGSSVVNHGEARHSQSRGRFA